jgi:hypothetical protein
MFETILVLVGCACIALSFVILWYGLRRLDNKLDQVHVLVNSKMTAALEEIEQLKLDVAHQKTLLDQRPQA